MLGLSATQMMSLKNGNGAYHRYMAALAAQEIIERMRANPIGLEQGGYDGTVDGTETSVDCSTSCSVAALTRLDLFEFGEVISTNLPSGTGKITRTGSEVTVSVKWKEQHTGENYGSIAGGVEDSSFEMIVEL
jgi:type IV pilus assembly protein PilV